MNIDSKKIEVKSTYKSAFITLLEHPDFCLQIADASGSEGVVINSQIHRNIIHFYFCLDGSAIFGFGPHYSRQIEKWK